MANAKTYGEQLFEEYLVAEGVSFECEPPISGVSQLFDFVVDHPTAGKVLIDVKDINNSPVVRGFSQGNSYQAIRAQIDDGRKKFKAVKDHICALIIVAIPCRSSTAAEAQKRREQKAQSPPIVHLPATP